jgi:nucleoside-diphosphate-sugar epimerase
VPDSSKLQSLIGFRPTVELDEILARVIESYRQH